MGLKGAPSASVSAWAPGRLLLSPRGPALHGLRAFAFGFLEGASPSSQVSTEASVEWDLSSLHFLTLPHLPVTPADTEDSSLWPAALALPVPWAANVYDLGLSFLTSPLLPLI